MNFALPEASLEITLASAESDELIAMPRLVKHTYSHALFPSTSRLFC